MRGKKCGDGLRQTQCAKDKSNLTGAVWKRREIIDGGEDLNLREDGNDYVVASPSDACDPLHVQHSSFP